MPDEDPPVPDPDPEPPPTPPPGKTFTQEQLNTFLAEERRKAQKANERTIKQLEELKKTHPFTSEEKEKLESRIEDLRNEYLTKEELSKKEQDKLRKEAKKKEEDLAKDRDAWKDRYTTYAIEQDIYTAAAQDAYNPMQVVNLLRPLTRLVEELNEDNQPTGKLVSKIRLASKDKDGNNVMLELSPSDAIKQMKEMQEHGNLFKSGAHSGVGGNSASTVPKNGPPLDDPAAYRLWRKASGLKR